jgi:hypothetical protein
MTTEAGTVAQLLAALRRRQRALNSVRGLVYGVMVGGVAGCLGAIATRSLGQAGLASLLFTAVLAAVFCMIAGAVVGAMSPISDLSLARALDRAGKGQDRFASALQLMNDRHTDRVHLVVQDALAHVAGTSPATALPMRMPRTARWTPVPFLALVAILFLLPQSKIQAAPPIAPEISPDQWKEISEEFNKELGKLPKPLTADEQELQKELEKLAEKLQQNPDKKDALKDIARLTDQIEKQQKAISAKEMSLRKAAKALAKSAALKQLASQMKEGQYQEASQELQAIADKMQNGELSPDAEEFEKLAEDLDKLAKETEADQELSKECQNSANAAAKMNKDELAKALKKMSEQMKNNAGKYSKSDNLAKHKKMLDELRRRMNSKKCEGDCDGDGFCDNPGDNPGNRPGKPGKGGLKAGWGSMAKWDGGKKNKGDEKRVGEMGDAQENQGENTTFQMVSPDEKARSTKQYAEMYAEFVQMAEADLDLESVPVSQREYLRKYFNSIRPKEAAPAGESGAKEENSEPAKP